MYKVWIKDFLDVILALIGLIILFPIFSIVFVCLLFINNGKPFFLQPRPGKNEKVFKIIKFKTMTDEKDAQGKLLPDELRRTSFGTFLRKSSLDEIPQLLNIIKGDMSLVGPRPLRVRYLPYYTAEEAIRHTVKPGVTGLAQVSGRNNLSWDDKLSFDITYVNSLSFTNDLIIIFRTIKKVFTWGGDEIEIGSDVLDLDELRKDQST
ncbi:sugar transferase [Seonamhaeicola marinus]|uniref:Sugar transferase n=1 Tax=Seonamhaeicola marinus TaxID=1912246 RepID=A0A5D0HKH6_9FLAO|nr:sugar transferase [Seonamhaeicola marinus]TYA71821.1 sugar transferase [Seonamhaeicola marinus]